MTKTTGMGRGSNPKSQAQLKKGSVPKYGERKQNWTLSITPTGIAGVKAIAMELGVQPSELLEMLARRQLVLSKIES